MGRTPPIIAKNALIRMNGAQLTPMLQFSNVLLFLMLPQGRNHKGFLYNFFWKKNHINKSRNNTTAVIPMSAFYSLSMYLPGCTWITIFFVWFGQWLIVLYFLRRIWTYKNCDKTRKCVLISNDVRAILCKYDLCRYLQGQNAQS